LALANASRFPAVSRRWARSAEILRGHVNGAPRSGERAADPWRKRVIFHGSLRHDEQMGRKRQAEIPRSQPGMWRLCHGWPMNRLPYLREIPGAEDHARPAAQSWASIASTSSSTPIGLAIAGYPAISLSRSRCRTTAERTRIGVLQTRESARIC